MSDHLLGREQLSAQTGPPVPAFPAGLPFPPVGVFISSTAITLPRPSPAWVVWLIAVLLALGISPDVIGLLLALLGLAPFVWPEATR